MTDTTAPEKPADWTYTRKTPAELETLAWDCVAGKVFGTWEPNSEMSFLILRLLDHEHITSLKRNNIAQAYEYLDKAGERSVNGMPSFLSCHYLDRHDWSELLKRCVEIENIQRQRAGAAHQAEASPTDKGTTP